MISENDEKNEPQVYIHLNDKVFSVPEKYRNTFGFIDYKHDGSFPWISNDEDVLLPPDYIAVTKLVAIDCEMVGVGPYKMDALGRVSIVNEHGYCIYDTFVKPIELITDYRTEFSGVREKDLIGAPSTGSVVQKVASIVEGKVLIGHSIHNDLGVLELNHFTSTHIRDTANFFQNRYRWSRTPSLKTLTKEYLKINIQIGEHSSIEDAQAALKLYLLFREEWENQSIERRRKANLGDTIADISCMHIEPRQTDLVVDSEKVFIRPNKVVGAYYSTEEYLDIQFRLLLEDLLRPLRYDVIRAKQGRRLENIFRKVRLSNVNQGGGTTFEVKNSKALMIPIDLNGLRDVDWEDPNIFLNGSLLLLSPDNFKSIRCAKVINIANTDNSNIDFYLRVYVDFLLDGPSYTVSDEDRFQMIESQAFFQPYQYALRFLQLIDDFDTYPMKKYIVDAVTKAEITQNIMGGSRKIDLSVLINETDFHTNALVNPLDYESWPKAARLNLDSSQFQALQNAMTQELTIIQGPPGTGKTHVSLQIVKLVLTNTWLNTTPMLIVAFTNHALDQLLEPVLEFLTVKIHGGNRTAAEQSLLRIGGGCKSDVILPCTVKFQQGKLNKKRQIIRRIKALNSAIFKIKDLQFETMLLKQGILNFQLVPQVMLSELATNEQSKYIFDLWTKSQKEIRKNTLLWFGLQNESIVFEPMSIFSSSRGLFLLACNNLSSILKDKIKDTHLTVNELKSRRLYDSNPQLQYSTRWGYYFFLIDQLQRIIKTFQNELKELNILKNDLDTYINKNAILKQAKIVGMTTTGAAKYKDKVVKKLKPKIMLVEEAAHVLEAYVVASLTQHCRQLILIGDHKQLRPMVSDYRMADNYLDVSLMERLVSNGIVQNTQNYTQLRVQHRMRPEIARLICPVIYDELENHSDVENYPNVKGCFKNIFFIHHENAESLDAQSHSRFNNYEAEYILGLLSYFIEYCGYLHSQITVICTYLAQKILLDKHLKDNLALNQVLISTVDGYQGKQNDIILLSLVRNNKEKNVGFLKTDNRVCVALSRARHGLFMIGNMSILASSSTTWSQINNVLTETESIGEELPLQYPDIFKIPVTRDTVITVAHVRKRSRRKKQNQKKKSQKCVIREVSKTETSKNSEGETAKVFLPFHMENMRDNNENASKYSDILKKSLQPVTSLKCHQDKKVTLPCGHKSYVLCYQQSFRSIIRKDLPCNHKADLVCGTKLSKIICNVKVILRLQCGHEHRVPCCHHLKKLKCGSMATKKMNCGHTISVACHKLLMTKCNATVTKTFSCGHTSNVPCYQQSCVSVIKKDLTCGHKTEVVCGTKETKIICNMQIKHCLPCGHEHRLLCGYNSKQIKCSSSIKTLLPCGHPRVIACHQKNLQVIKCKTLLKLTNSKETIRCYEFMAYMAHMT